MRWAGQSQQGQAGFTKIQIHREVSGDEAGVRPRQEAEPAAGLVRVTQIQLSITCKVNQSRWEQKGECTHMSKDRTRVPHQKLGAEQQLCHREEPQWKWISCVVNSTDTIHSWQCCFFSLSSLQIWPPMTQWNTFCFWTQHLWTIVWLTVLAGAVFSNYPFSTVEHCQPCCLHLPPCASRRPHSLILILVMKCNFRIIFFPARTSLNRRYRRKDATIATKLPSLEVPCWCI